MWTPKQLLTDEAVDALRQGGFSEATIECLGWYNGIASAISNSNNPVKAAHTILSKERTKTMVDAFIAKKKESVAPKVEAEDHREVTRKLVKLEEWQRQVEAESTPKAKTAAADGHDGAAE